MSELVTRRGSSEARTEFTPSLPSFLRYLQQLPNLLPLQKPSYSSFLPFFGSSAVCTCDLPNLLPLKKHPLKLLPLLFWVIYCMYIYTTKSVTAIKAFLQLLPSLFLGHLPYVHISYQICYHPELNPIRPLVNTETGTKPEVTGSDLSLTCRDRNLTGSGRI